MMTAGHKREHFEKDFLAKLSDKELKSPAEMSHQEEMSKETKEAIDSHLEKRVSEMRSKANG